MKSFQGLFIILITSLFIAGCGEDGGSSGGGGGGGGGGACEPSSALASKSYTVSWDEISDPGEIIEGYKVYFSTTETTVTKTNADGSFEVDGSGSDNTHEFTPGDYLITTCIDVNFAVATVQGSKESDLSETVSILIE